MEVHHPIPCRKAIGGWFSHQWIYWIPPILLWPETHRSVPFPFSQRCRWNTSLAFLQILS